MQSAELGAATFAATCLLSLMEEETESLLAQAAPQQHQGKASGKSPILSKGKGSEGGKWKRLKASAESPARALEPQLLPHNSSPNEGANML